MRVIQRPLVEGDVAEGEIAKPWSKDARMPDDDTRKTWTDVCKVFTSKDEFLAKYLGAFNPIITYAALDDDGWHAPGEMGWFGCSSDKPDAKLEFVGGFMGKFLKSPDGSNVGNPDDVLVVVDCHI